ncbi:MAG TPA: metal-sulfur cluster assembly factor [Solirubrobacteraceae bacterium]|jgi:metal-sulfur cluster biosynthetic enzyme|nr:metal-sulfur cluster assembly factor [Solirubrobacteraceae bacterium]
MSATLADLEGALRAVHDPEYPVSVVDMGLIRGLALDGATARVRLTYTSMGCPCKEMIADDVRDALLAVEGVEAVEVEEVFEPWSHRDLSGRARTTLSELGVT